MKCAPGVVDSATDACRTAAAVLPWHGPRLGLRPSHRVRFVDGSYRETGPASVWARPHIPLVAEETTSPVQRLAIVSDSANGLSAELSQQEWAFISPTMPLTLGREPASE